MSLSEDGLQGIRTATLSLQIGNMGYTWSDRMFCPYSGLFMNRGAASSASTFQKDMHNSGCAALTPIRLNYLHYNISSEPPASDFELSLSAASIAWRSGSANGCCEAADVCAQT